MTVNPKNKYSLIHRNIKSDRKMIDARELGRSIDRLLDAKSRESCYNKERLMKRKCIILGSIFMFFLVLGIWLNGQKGMNLMSDFWVLEKDGSFTHQDNRILCVNTEAGNRFEIALGKTVLTVTIEEQEDGWYMESDKGWGIKIPSENYLSVLVGVAGGTIWVGDAQITIHDVETMDLNFEAVKEEEKNFIYDENGKPIGESYHLISESGKTISYREVWYDSPEYDSPQQPVEVIKDGITLDSEKHQNKLYVNEKGEYLMNPTSLFMISDGQGYISKAGLVQTLVKVVEGKVEQRGHLSLAAAYIFFYVLGTAILLWPEKMAFLGNRWRYRSEPELSDEGLVMEMLGGVVIICMAVVILFLPLAG